MQIKITQRTSIALRGTAPSTPDRDLVVIAVCLDPACAGWAGWDGVPAWELVYDGPAGPVFTDRKNRTENPGNGQWTISLTRLRGLAPG